MKASEAAMNALSNVLGAVKGESLNVVCDKELKEVGEAFTQGALDLGMWARLALQEPDSLRTGIPGELRELIVSQTPDIYVNCLRGTTEETPFRIQTTRLQTRRRVRLGHCPGITYDMLTEGALALTTDDYVQMHDFVDNLLVELDGGQQISVLNDSGTDLSLSIKGRPFFTDTRVDWQTLKWMNLPVGEVLVAPIESSLNGKLVCETAVGGIGLLKAPVVLEIEDGKVKSMETEDDMVGQRISKALATDSLSSIIGEFAFGINKKARKVQEFLETEKIWGTCHFGFGNNSDYPGGQNTASNHMDFLVQEPIVSIRYGDEREERILQGYEFSL